MINAVINETISAEIDADDPHEYGRVRYLAARGNKPAIDSLKALLRQSPGLYLATIDPDYTTAADLDAACKYNGIFPTFDVTIRPYRFPRQVTP